LNDDQLFSNLKVDAFNPKLLDTVSNTRSKSTSGSSHTHEEQDYSSGLSDFEEEAQQAPQQALLKKATSIISESTTTQWKCKVRTELCKYWLRGLPCENREKENGCGFAHGEAELMPKSGLNEKYLTTVCKKFLEHPSKCTYGDRCIF